MMPPVTLTSATRSSRSWVRSRRPPLRSRPPSISGGTRSRGVVGASADGDRRGRARGELTVRRLPSAVTADRCGRDADRRRRVHRGPCRCPPAPTTSRSRRATTHAWPVLGHAALPAVRPDFGHPDRTARRCAEILAMKPWGRRDACSARRACRFQLDSRRSDCCHAGRDVKRANPEVGTPLKRR